MKSCDNCSNKDWCLITKPDRYYELMIFGGSSICPDYKEKETDMKSCEKCLLNNSCVDYYAKNGNSQVCEWYTEVKEETHFCDECQDYVHCDLVDHDKEHGGKCCGDFREAESNLKGPIYEVTLHFRGQKDPVVLEGVRSMVYAGKLKSWILTDISSYEFIINANAITYMRKVVLETWQ